MRIGPSLKHTAFSGTTTRWYVPGSSAPVHIVVPPLATAAGAVNGITSAIMAMLVMANIFRMESLPGF
jgi:hypothetical protein